MYFVLIILYEYFWVLERIIWVSIISYGEIHFDIRVLWITSTFPEWIMLANHGTTVQGLQELKRNISCLTATRLYMSQYQINSEHSWQSKKCRSLDISQPYGLQWPVTDVAFIFTPKTCNCTLFLLPAGTDVLQYDGTSDRQFRKDKLCRLFAKQENIFKKFCLEDNAKAASLT
jgi:hypothetical protein